MAELVRNSDELMDRLQRGTMRAEEALELFDALPIVPLDTMIGRWRGSEVYTNHPMNGWLEVLGWYGKAFLDHDHVHPLLFSDSRGNLFALDPKRLPFELATWPLPRIKQARQLLLVARGLLQTRKTRARLRMIEYRGKVSAAMLYDHVPIYDAFRLTDQDTVLGAMDLKGMKQPFFFKLHRDG